jgi:hypothetical protein
MTILLSNLTFTDQDDIVPASGVDYIFNGGIVNTLAGDDIITGTRSPEDYPFTQVYGIYNTGSIYTNDGDDIIAGIDDGISYGFGIDFGGILDTGNGNDLITGTSRAGYGIYGRSLGTINTGDGNDTIAGTNTNGASFVSGIRMQDTVKIDTGKGNDIITGTGLGGGIFQYEGFWNTGEGDDIINGSSISPGFGFIIHMPIDTGDGNDTITGTGGNVHDGDGIPDYSVGFSTFDLIYTGNGNDIITGIATNADYSTGIANSGIIDTGNGENIITGTGTTYGIINYDFSIINTGNSKDSLISHGKFTNYGGIFLEDGNDSLTASTSFPNGRALENLGFIGTGDGNDIIITSASIIYNEGVIETGNGDDSIIVDGGIDDLTGTSYGIYNKGGAINMGDGNDSIIANEGFKSAENSSGAWFLGEGDDYIKGYGSGDFYGGNGNDTLELTPGTYTVGIWDRVTLSKGNSLMLASEFEQLKAGSTIYDFTSLTAGQIIVVP